MFPELPIRQDALRARARTPASGGSSTPCFPENVWRAWSGGGPPDGDCWPRPQPQPSKPNAPAQAPPA